MKDWYKEVHMECAILAGKHRLKLWQVAGVLTALSAQKKWELNIQQTRELLAGKPITGLVSRHQLATCDRILSGEQPLDVFDKYSHKYRNFYSCIVNPTCERSVCVDTHMINWYLSLHPHSKLHGVNYNRIFESPHKYGIIQSFIRRKAKEAGLLPSQYQAIVWAEQREKNIFV